MLSVSTGVADAGVAVIVIDETADVLNLAEELIIAVSVKLAAGTDDAATVKLPSVPVIFVELKPVKSLAC